MSKKHAGDPVRSRTLFLVLAVADGSRLHSSYRTGMENVLVTGFQNIAGILLILLLTTPRQVFADTVWDYRKEFLPHLVNAVPDILADQETTSGRFGKGIWIVQDQHVIFPLAAVWSIKDDANPYFHDQQVLEAVMAAGDALIAEQDRKGQWEFRKKDGSTWGPIYMPWTYSRWVRAYGLIRDAMPPERREKWEQALTLGYEGIAKNEFDHVHNIPAHHGMGLYFAGKALDRPEWVTSATAFLRRVADTQHPDGYWSENSGPVVGYNFVYTDALGAYYGASKDEAVLPALRRSAGFHANFTYPDGTPVETIDERQVYKAGANLPNVGFTHSPDGRGYLRRQWKYFRHRAKPLTADLAASMILYGSVGEETEAPSVTEPHQFVTGDGKAMVRREGPWFVCLSAYTSPVYHTRWIQDRQNLVSLYHDKTRLIMGGGNTKLQPLWSTFTAGNPDLLKHTAGNEKPDFTPPPGIIHVPTTASLETSALAMNLEYGDTACRVQVDLSDPERARLVYSVDPDTTMPVEAHLPFMAVPGRSWESASGKQGKLDGTHWKLTAEDAGEWFGYNGWRVSLPEQSTVTWPALPHNPYRKDGSAEPAEGRIVLTLPFSPTVTRHEITIEVPKD